METPNTAPTNESSVAPVENAKLALALDLLAEAGARLAEARQILQRHSGLPAPAVHRPVEALSDDGPNQVIEGVFDGQQMVGPDGKHYSVPANYASKSKLVEGDLLKLTISERGAFVYKQIGPIGRRRLVGRLDRGPAGSDFVVTVGERAYRVLTASVTYFRGHPGDSSVVLVPENGESKWAALENIMKSGDAESVGDVSVGTPSAAIDRHAPDLGVA